MTVDRSILLDLKEMFIRAFSTRKTTEQPSDETPEVSEGITQRHLNDTEYTALTRVGGASSDKLKAQR